MTTESRPPASPSERRLAAIVFTDVVGYSARMQQDEAGTLALVRIDFERMRALGAGHGGEVLKSMGDGLLLCFASVVQAVACALQIQKEFGVRPADALQHRIGIHLGDVFRADGDVTGDGVNIAARLQTRARPGTICLSQSVYDAVKGKVPMAAEPLGPQRLKNIAEPVSVYLVAPEAATLPSAVRPPGSGGRKFRGWWLAGELLLVAGLVAYGLWPKPAPPTAGPKPAAATSSAPSIADKSIAVLPFANMSDDKANAFFADGIHEDVLTDLANVGDLRVVSRTSVMQYRDTTKSIHQIAAELGVNYVLEGSVRRAGNTVRVTGQLINARTDEEIWAKSYDRDLKDIFAIQSSLATEITDTLQAVLSPRDKARLGRARTSSSAAYDLYLKAIDIRNRVGDSMDAFTRAEPLLESAVEMDPNFATAWGELALVHLGINSRSYDPTGEHLEQAQRAIDTMARLAPDDPETWIQLGRYYADRGDYSRSEDYLRQAGAALPNNGRVVVMLADEDRRHGRLAEALRHYRKAYELDRQNPEIRGKLQDWLLDIRRYDELAVLEREDPQGDGYALAVLAFYAHGSTQEMEAWLAGHPSASVEQILDWKFITGDAAEFVKLADQARHGQPTGIFDSHRETQYAAALMSLGEPARAHEAWARNLARIKMSNKTNYPGIAVNLALLGEKREAYAALDTWRAQDTVPGLNPDYSVHNLAPIVVEVWVGDRAKALKELGRLLRIPTGLNVHQLRRDPFYKPLQGDPGFEALLRDPANNAPLL